MVVLEITQMSHLPLPIFRSFLTTSTIWNRRAHSIDMHLSTWTLTLNSPSTSEQPGSNCKKQTPWSSLVLMRSALFRHTLISSSRSSLLESKAPETTLTLLVTNTDELNNQPNAKPKMSLLSIVRLALFDVAYRRRIQPEDRQLYSFRWTKRLRSSGNCRGKKWLVTWLISKQSMNCILLAWERRHDREKSAFFFSRNGMGRKKISIWNNKKGHFSSSHLERSRRKTMSSTPIDSGHTFAQKRVNASSTFSTNIWRNYLLEILRRRMCIGDEKATRFLKENVRSMKKFSARPRNHCHFSNRSILCRSHVLRIKHVIFVIKRTLIAVNLWLSSQIIHSLNRCYSLFEFHLYSCSRAKRVPFVKFSDWL